MKLSQSDPSSTARVGASFYTHFLYNSSWDYFANLPESSHHLLISGFRFSLVAVTEASVTYSCR